MSAWKRATKEIPFERLPPEMVSAIHQHIEQYNLGSILSDVLMCILTNSEKMKKGLFGSAETVQMGAIVTRRWLVSAITGTKTPTAVFSAQLTNITVQDYAQTQLAKMSSDSGIQVSGMFTDASESASAFIGLDEGAAGNKFREIAIKAAQDAKK
ncbi:MAG TPA: hypothetical protein VMN99_10470 [Anaerolineales bacterium]|nr:hypothetical protein [Anaerolineales bacterium]